MSGGTAKMVLSSNGEKSDRPIIVRMMPSRTTPARNSRLYRNRSRRIFIAPLSQLHARIDERIEDVDHEHRRRHRDDGNCRDAEDEAVIAGIDRRDQQAAYAGIAED